jgi:hypothetical protein
MADVISPTIAVIQACIGQYQTFCSLKKVCQSFRNSLRVIVSILQDLKQQLPAYYTSGSLVDATELLKQATQEGSKVLKKCTTMQPWEAFFYAKKGMERLTTATSNINQAITLVQLACEVMNLAINQQNFVRLEKHLEDVAATKEATDLDREEVMDVLQRNRGGARAARTSGNMAASKVARKESQKTMSTAKELSDLLVRMGVAKSNKDFARNLDELKKVGGAQWASGEEYDTEMLKAVKALPTSDAVSPSTFSSLAGSGLKKAAPSGRAYSARYPLRSRVGRRDDSGVVVPDVASSSSSSLARQSRNATHGGVASALPIQHASSVPDALVSSSSSAERMTSTAATEVPASSDAVDQPLESSSAEPRPPAPRQAARRKRARP